MRKVRLQKNRRTNAGAFIANAATDRLVVRRGTGLSRRRVLYAKVTPLLAIGRLVMRLPVAA